MCTHQFRLLLIAACIAPVCDHARVNAGVNLQGMNKCMHTHQFRLLLIAACIAPVCDHASVNAGVEHVGACMSECVRIDSGC